MFSHRWHACRFLCVSELILQWPTYKYKDEQKKLKPKARPGVSRNEGYILVIQSKDIDKKAAFRHKTDCLSVWKTVEWNIKMYERHFSIDLFLVHFFELWMESFVSWIFLVLDLTYNSYKDHKKRRGTGLRKAIGNTWKGTPFVCWKSVQLFRAIFTLKKYNYPQFESNNGITNPSLGKTISKIFSNQTWFHSFIL